MLMDGGWALATQHLLKVIPLCPDKALGRHCTTCKCEGDVKNWYNLLRNVHCSIHSAMQLYQLTLRLDVAGGWTNQKLDQLVITSYSPTGMAVPLQYLTSV